MSLNHPIPRSEESDLAVAVRDKYIKLAAAWSCAKSEWNPDYVMKVDWDDLISSKLVKWLNSAKSEPGYLITAAQFSFCKMFEHLN